MAWDSVKAAEDIVLSSDYNSGVTDQKTRVPGTSAAGAPSSAPTVVPSLYTDTTNGRLYFAAGTNNVSDWKQLMST